MTARSYLLLAVASFLGLVAVDVGIDNLWLRTLVVTVVVMLAFLAGASSVTGILRRRR